MRSFHMLLALVLATPTMSAAQGAPATGASEAAQDTAAPAPKKKGGLFGKMKGFSKNHFVNTVAKTALCTAVPGGSMLASAMDAKKAKTAKDAAGAAANVAGGTGGTCMPVMGLAAKAEAAAGVGGVPGTGIPGLSTTGLSQAALSAAQMQQLQQLQQAKSTPGAMTAGQIKQMQEQYRKMGMKPEQIAMMQAQIQAMQQTMAAASRASREAPAAPAASPAAVAAVPPGAAATAGTEPTLTTEEGHFVLRGIAWIPRSAALQPGSESSFTFAMHDVAAALQGSGKRYRVETRVEEQGKKSLNLQLARQRASVVIAGLVSQGVPADHLTASDGKADKDSRILVQEIK